MIFAYQAINAEGQRIKGQLEARCAVDLENQLKLMALELIRYKPLAPGRQIYQTRIPRQELINFCFHLEQLSLAGVPLVEGLGDLRDSLDHPLFRRIVSDLCRRIENGETLSQAMRSHPQAFNPIFINLISAGESSGQIPEILANLGENMKWEDELTAQTKKLLLYPTFVAGIVAVVTIFLMMFMVPQLKTFVKTMGQDLPLHTRLLFSISDTLAAYGHWLFALFLILLIGLHFFIRSNSAWQYPLDVLKLRLPVVGGILNKIILARFAGVFAMLYAAGIPILSALENTAKTLGNQPLERALQTAGERINEGLSLSEAFRQSGLFPPLMLRMLHVGESTGGLDSALRNVAYFYHRDIRESVSKAQTLIEPALTLFMGLLLGWIMLAVIGPIYDVISRIKL